MKMKTTSEAQLTEEALSGIDGLNAKISSGEVKPRKLMVASLDVKALCLSMVIKSCAQIAKKR